VAGRRGRRRKQLAALGSLKKKRGYLKLEEVALDRILCRNGWEEAIDLTAE